MASQIHCSALIRFFQKLATMQRSLRDQRVVILLPEPSGTVQSTRDDAHGLELSSGIADSFLVDSKSLREELVRDLLKAGLIGYLAAADKEAETEIGGPVAGVEGGNGRVHEFVQGRGLRGPVVVVMFSGFVLSSEFDGRSEDGGGGEFDAFVAVGEGFAGGLEEFELGVVVGTLDEVNYPG